MNNKMLWVFLGGVVVGCFLAANLPVIPDQILAMQNGSGIDLDIAGSFDAGYSNQGGW